MRVASANAHDRERRTALPATAGAPAIAVRGVSHGFASKRGEVTVLDGIDFEVADGEFLALMGPSGCGKSTLLSLVAGFATPLGGTVEHHGLRVDGPHWTRGVVFQSPALYPWLTVQENVLFGPRVRHAMDGARERARRLIAEVGLAGFESHYPYELSGGMRHRVALARTLANEPQTLLMDEPFAALDAQTRGEMQELLLNVWQHHRCTVLFVTHDIEEALLLADRVLVMSHRPSGIRATVTVRIPRPRSYETVMEPDVVAMRGRVRELLERTGAGSTETDEEVA